MTDNPFSSCAAGAPGSDDHGVTLIELLVATTILGIIMATLGGALVVGLRTSDDAAGRLAESAEAQLVARYLVPDTQSATFIDDRTSTPTLNLGCADTASDVLRLWSPSASTQGVAVVYGLRTVGGVKQLVRSRCAPPAAVRTTVLARGLTSASALVVGSAVELTVQSTTGQRWTVSSTPRVNRSLAVGPSAPSSTTSTTPLPPQLLSLEARDADQDGYVERVVATFSAAVRCTGGTCLTSPWSWQGQAPSGASLGSVSVSGSTATLNLVGHSATKSTAVSNGFKVSLSSASGGLEGASSPSLPVQLSSQAVADKAAPVLVAAGLRDANSNGKVDRLEATFTEDLASTTDATPWTLTAIPSGGSRGSVSSSGPIATVLIAEGTGAADTAVGAMKVSLAAAATGVRDASGNQASFGLTTPVDQAAPVALAVTSANGGTVVGQAEQNDTITVTFSEAIVGAPSTADVSLTTTNGSDKPVILTLPGVASGPVAIGNTPDYLAKSSSASTMTGSAVTTSGAAVQIRLAAPAGGTRTPGSYVAGTTSVFTPAANLRDGAGNAATGMVTITVRFF